MANQQSLREYIKFDIFAFGNGFGGTVWGSLTYYFGVPIAFLTFLKASSFQIGLVTAIFWAGFAIPQVWAAYATENYKIKKHFMAKVLLISNLSWLVAGLYIIITKAANPVMASWLFLILFTWACAVVGMFIPGQFSLLFKIIPTSRLGQLLGILFAVQFLSLFVGGPIINLANTKFTPPYNFAVLFFLTFVITIIITFILLSIKEPEGEDMEKTSSFGAYIGKCLDIVKTDKTLTTFIFGKWLMTGHYIMLAFMLAFLMNERGFDPAKIGYFNAFHGIGMFIGGFTITKIADLYGPKQMLVTAHIIALIYTLIVWLIPTASPLLIFVAFALTGFSQVSDNVGYSNMCMFCCPTLDKSTYVAVTNVGVNILTVPLPMIFGKLMDMGIMGFNGMFTIVVAMMVAAIIFVGIFVRNPQSFIDMKAAAKVVKV